MRYASALVLALLCAWAHAQVRQDDGLAHFRYPGHTWVMAMKLDGFEIKEAKVDQQEGLYALAQNTKTGVIVSVTMESAREAGDSKTCWAYFLPNIVNPNDKNAYKTFELGRIAVLEYVYKLGDVMEVQKHFNGYLVEGDVWIDIHISKNNYKDEERPLLYALLESVEFPKCMELYLEAQRHQREKADAAALKCMAAALAMEKKEAKFSQRMFRELITDLAVAYGVSGDLEKAKETLEYGLQRDPTYPLFLYNMACYYAEKGDLENTLPMLQKAFENKDKLSPGSQMPDPRTDSSFQRFQDNERFKKLLAELGL